MTSIPNTSDIPHTSTPDTIDTQANAPHTNLCRANRSRANHNLHVHCRLRANRSLRIPHPLRASRSLRVRRRHGPMQFHRLK